MEDFRKKFILALLAYAAQRDVPVAELCERSGIKDITKDIAPALTNAQVEKLWNNAAHAAKDPLFGLHFGEAMQLAALGMVGQIIQTSNTIGEALTHAGGLIHLLTDMFTLRLEHGKANVTLVLIEDSASAKAYPATFRHMADFLMVFTVHELDGLLLQKLQPLRARFAREINVAEYNRTFRCQVHGNSDEYSITFDNKALDLPILSANYDLHHHLLQKVEQLRRGQEGSVFRTRIYNYLLTNSFLNSPSLDDVAANFNMSSRSLQRRLKDEGSTYLEVLDDVRKALALSYLQSASFQAKDVAFILGYKEQRAFFRAFKRWTGKTPSGYRESL